MPVAEPELLRQDDYRAALRRLVAEGGELRGVGDVGLRVVADGYELRRLTVAEGDGAGLVEQERVDVAGGLDGAAGHGEDVVLDETVHSGDADGGEQAADGRRHEADEQGDEHGDRDRFAGVDGVGLERHDNQDEEDRQPGKEDVQGDLVRRLLARGAFDEGDHVVEERLPGLGGDADPYLVG